MQNSFMQVLVVPCLGIIRRAAGKRAIVAALKG
jgi:hypothetical protein